MATPITDSNHNGFLVATAADLDLAGKLDRLLTEVGALRADVTAMRSAWAEYEPVVAAFRRGGWLAARSAAKRAGHGVPGVQ